MKCTCVENVSVLHACHCQGMHTPSLCTLFANATDSQLWLFACFGNCKLVVVILTLVYCCWSKLLCRSWLAWWFSMRRKDWVFFKSYLYIYTTTTATTLQVAICACCICASATRNKTTSPIWSRRQQQHNLHTSTTMKHASAHVQVACCCCIPLQLAPMDAGAQSPWPSATCAGGVFHSSN